MDSKKIAAQNFDYVVEMRRDFHKNPEASLQEFRTTDVLAAEMEKMGIPYRRFEPTGLIATIEGGKPGKTVALRADIDALSIQEKSGVEFSSVNDGLMHACGHDTHASMLLGAAKGLMSIKDELQGTVKIIFQPAEEVALGAKKIIEQGALDGVDMIFGMHIFSQAPVGLIAVGEGPSAAAADVFKIKVKGTAAHGAMPDLGNDALLAASAIVLNLQSIVSREVSPNEAAVVTVGTLQSGSRFNIVSGDAEMEGTVRTFNRDLHNSMENRIRRIAENTAQAYNCTAELEYTYLTEVLINAPEASAICKKAALEAVASPALVAPMPKMMGAEDFADYTSLANAGFVGLGGGGEHPQHSDYFYIEEEALKTGVAWYIQVAHDALEELA